MGPAPCTLYRLMRAAILVMLLLPLAGCYSERAVPDVQPEALRAAVANLNGMGWEEDGSTFSSDDVDRHAHHVNLWPLVSLGLIWPTRDRVEIVIEPSLDGGSILKTRRLSHLQLFYVVPIVWTDEEYERKLASLLVKKTVPR